MSRDPRNARVFHFAGRQFDPATGEARLSYRVDDQGLLTERVRFPHAPWPSDASRQAAFFRALEMLHLVAGVSYYKAGLAARIDTGDLGIDAPLAAFAQRLYERGLAEFAYCNGLDLAGRIEFPAGAALQPVAADLDLPPRTLLAMGGGKDSLVSLELLRGAGEELLPFCVGASTLIGDTVRVAGLPLIRIERRLAPELTAMNQAGAWNGHVPVTAIHSAIGLCAALLYGFRWVAFSNERSADEATRRDERGQPVNHQYSKSFEFESDFAAMVRRHVSPGVAVFSLLRPFTELAIAGQFSGLDRYHGVFSSCNRNFHQDGSRIEGRWCGNCPKCRFTTLALAPFLSPQAVSGILGANLLDQASQEDGFRALLDLGKPRPFECVGTVDECRAALRALAANGSWTACRLVPQLLAELPPGASPSLADCLAPRGPHDIPGELRTRLGI